MTTDESSIRSSPSESRGRWFALREVERHVEINKRYSRPFALLVLSLDNLRWIRDTLGEATGESALEYVATHIQMHLREADIVCRCKDDLFLVIMQETNRREATAAGRRMVESVEKTRFKVDEAFVTIDVSHSAASCPEDGIEPEVLLQAAGYRD